jgi:hypothetical protein
LQVASCLLFGKDGNSSNWIDSFVQTVMTGSPEALVDGC